MMNSSSLPPSFLSAHKPSEWLRARLFSAAGAIL